MIRYIVAFIGVLFLNMILDGNHNYIFEEETSFKDLVENINEKDLEINKLIIDEYKNLVYVYPSGNITFDNPILYLYTSQNNHFVAELNKYLNEPKDYEIKYSPSYGGETTRTLLVGYIKNLLLFVFLGTVILNILGSSLSFISEKGFPGSMMNDEEFFSVCKKPVACFNDVVGQEEAKEDLRHYVNSVFWHRKEYLEAGYQIPKGLLFTGPPGTGKTLLAKAFAAQAFATFISLSGSDFDEMFVGVGSKRVKKLFSYARKHSPSVIFIDEIDAVGRKREGKSSGHNEKSTTLNKLLVEMDGFTANDKIMVIAATNMPKVLDPALIRSGRFDKEIIFDRPNKDERNKLLSMYLKNIKLHDNFLKNWENNLKILAKDTAGLNGADISNIANQSIATYLGKKLKNVETDIDLKELEKSDDPDEYYKARRKNRENNEKRIRFYKVLGDNINEEQDHEQKQEGVELEDIQRSIDIVMIGMEKRERTMSEKERRIVSYHEAGHALVAYIIKQTNPPIKVSIVPRGKSALGFSQQEPTDQKIYTEMELFGKVCVLFGGRVSEEIMFDHLSTGASDDLEKISDILHNMVMLYGINQIGPLNQNQYKYLSDKTKEQIDEAKNKIFCGAEKETKEILNSNKNLIELLADHLLENEVIKIEEIEKMLEEYNVKDSVDLSVRYI